MLKPAMGALAALSLMSGVALTPQPASAGGGYDYGWYYPTPALNVFYDANGWLFTYSRPGRWADDPYWRSSYPARQINLAENPYWRAEVWRARHTPNYFSSGLTAGSFGCEHDPAYHMDPRCYNR